MAKVENLPEFQSMSEVVGYLASMIGHTFYYKGRPVDIIDVCEIDGEMRFIAGLHNDGPDIRINKSELLERIHDFRKIIEEPGTKRCESCHHIKLIRHFYEDGRTSDGYSKKCMDCSAPRKNVRKTTKSPPAETEDSEDKQPTTTSMKTLPPDIPRDIDQELDAMREIAKLLLPLREDMRSRVLDWVIVKLDIKPE